MNIKYLVSLILISSLYGQDDDDMDAMWDNTIWNEIEDIADEEIQKMISTLQSVVDKLIRWYHK